MNFILKTQPLSQKTDILNIQNIRTYPNTTGILSNKELIIKRKMKAKDNLPIMINKTNKVQEISYFNFLLNPEKYNIKDLENSEKPIISKISDKNNQYKDILEKENNLSNCLSFKLISKNNSHYSKNSNYSRDRLLDDNFNNNYNNKNFKSYNTNGELKRRLANIKLSKANVITKNNNRKYISNSNKHLKNNSKKLFVSTKTNSLRKTYSYESLVNKDKNSLMSIKNKIKNKNSTSKFSLFSRKLPITANSSININNIKKDSAFNLNTIANKYNSNYISDTQDNTHLSSYQIPQKSSISLTNNKPINSFSKIAITENNNNDYNDNIIKNYKASDVKNFKDTFNNNSKYLNENYINNTNNNRKSMMTNLKRVSNFRPSFINIKQINDNNKRKSHMNFKLNSNKSLDLMGNRHSYSPKKSNKVKLINFVMNNSKSFNKEDSKNMDNSHISSKINNSAVKINNLFNKELQSHLNNKAKFVNSNSNSNQENANDINVYKECADKIIINNVKICNSYKNDNNKNKNASNFLFCCIKSRKENYKANTDYNCKINNDSNTAGNMNNDVILINDSNSNSNNLKGISTSKLAKRNKKKKLLNYCCF